MGKSFDDENRLRKAKGLPLLKKEEKKEETKKTGKGTGGFASLFGGDNCNIYFSLFLASTYILLPVFNFLLNRC